MNRPIGKALCPAAAKHKPTANRILICRPNVRLGNTLLLTPLLQELETIFPGAEVDIVTACEAAGEIFREFACVRTLYQLPRHGVAHPWRWLGTFLRARRKVYDLVIDPCPGSWSSRFWTRAMSTRYTVGFTSPSTVRSPTTISVAAKQAPPHMGQYPVYLVRQALEGGEDRRDAPVPPLELFLTDAERDFGRRKLLQLCAPLAGDGPIVAVFAAATGAKQLPISWWQAVLSQIMRQVPAIRFVEIIPANGEALLSTPAAYYSTSIRRLAAVISAADGFVSADSGVMHLAAATDTQTIGLFTVTNPAVYEPYGRQNAALSVEASAPERAADRIVRLFDLTAQESRPPLVRRETLSPSVDGDGVCFRPRSAAPILDR